MASNCHVYCESFVLKKPTVSVSLLNCVRNDLVMHLYSKGKPLHNNLIMYSALFSFYTNLFYKNIEAEMCKILRIF